MRYELTHIGVFSVFKVYLVLGIILGLIIGILIALIGLPSIYGYGMGPGLGMPPSHGPAVTGGGLAFAGIGLVGAIIGGIIYGVIAGIVGAIAAFLYNVVAGMVGGIEIELEEKGL